MSKLPRKTSVPPFQPHNSPRTENALWQRDAVAYLRSGVAAVLVREGGNGFQPATLRRLYAGMAVTRLGSALVLVPVGASPAGAMTRG